VALDFLAFEMRDGRNYFRDESKSFSECCRLILFEAAAFFHESLSNSKNILCKTLTERRYHLKNQLFPVHNWKNAGIMLNYRK
jgi:hypothetical protein